MIPFAKTRAERLASGDPRLSIEERYGTVWAYYFLLIDAINKLSQQGFMLPDDASTALNTGLQNMLNSAALPKREELILKKLMH